MAHNFYQFTEKNVYGTNVTSFPTVKYNAHGDAHLQEEQNIFQINQQNANYKTRFQQDNNLNQNRKSLLGQPKYQYVNPHVTKNVNKKAKLSLINNNPMNLTNAQMNQSMQKRTTSNDNKPFQKVFNQMNNYDQYAQTSQQKQQQQQQQQQQIYLQQQIDPSQSLYKQSNGFNGQQSKLDFSPNPKFTNKNSNVFIHNSNLITQNTFYKNNQNNNQNPQKNLQQQQSIVLNTELQRSPLKSKQQVNTQQDFYQIQQLQKAQNSQQKKTQLIPENYVTKLTNQQENNNNYYNTNTSNFNRSNYNQNPMNQSLQQQRNKQQQQYVTDKYRSPVQEKQLYGSQIYRQTVVGYQNKNIRSDIKNIMNINNQTNYNAQNGQNQNQEGESYRGRKFADQKNVGHFYIQSYEQPKVSEFLGSNQQGQQSRKLENLRISQNINNICGGGSAMQSPNNYKNVANASKTAMQKFSEKTHKIVDPLKQRQYEQALRNRVFAQIREERKKQLKKLLEKEKQIYFSSI